MQKIVLSTIILLVAAPILPSCGEGSESDVGAHRKAVLAWRAGRLERLMAPTGYLTLAGLYWLDVGTYSFGSDDTNDLVFPAGSAPVIGEFDVSADGVAMRVQEGVPVSSNGTIVSSILISDDTTDVPVAIQHGTLAWTAVKRNNRFAVRLRDFDHPALEAFGALPYYNIDPRYRVTARLRRYEELRIVNVGTVIEGLGWNPESPGIVEFEIDEFTYEIEAYVSDDELFFVFGDETNAGETYGAGRFLYSALPGEDGVLELDFNQSYSPPCAFNDFATCPVASPRNRIAVRIEAGEKYDAALHYSAAQQGGLNKC